MKKRTFAMLSLLTSFSMVLSACGDGGESSSGNSSEPGASQGGEKASSQPAEITIMLPLNTAETPPDTIKNEVEKLTNTKLTYQFFPADTYEEKLNTSFATGSLPDVTYLKNQATFIQMKEAIRDGQFWEIGPYLSEFENLNKLKPLILENTKVDGKLYSLYIGRPLARQGLIYRKDWADKLGIEAPTNVDEFYTMLKAFKEQDPDGDGQDNTIGLTDRNDLVYGAFKTVASWYKVPNNWGEKDGQLQPDFTFPEYMETLDFFKKLHQEGLINQDFAATSKTDQVNLFTSGKAGAYVGAMSDINSLHKDLIKNAPDAVLDVESMIAGPTGEASTWAIPGYNNVILFPTSAIKDEAELKQVLAFFDKMMTPEVANLMYWGQEGVHYTVEDGKAKASEDQEKTEREVKGYKDSVIGEPETNGMYEGYHDLPGRIHAEELTVANEEIAVHDPTAALDSETYTTKGVELQTIITDATYKYIYGTLDQAGFEAAVAQWKKQGGEQIIQEFNEAYAAKK
ncbi:extracellular solute-binding protein [Paenibacillus shunpengii]|uniref:Extracellular solute-binding protein n=1 Tax=Paenibacillus shunpengii TaxID=2054424 RepID=A0ABW5SUC2_9BACL|nr:MULTISPECIES: extracellular solute-binding protein [unclassified Paenibacillus]OMC64759.1 ABC transporter substrate-binding protein [Paenibacillus sp. FSL H7-0326]SDX48762.1 carbohydrate ABC transporter substrate-binding protein, CUT1 family [Paenibacillus sp. PDC88]